MSFAALTAPLAATALALASGCSSTKEECSCAPTGIRVVVPDDRAGDVQGLTLAGAACASGSSTCVREPSGGQGCAEYRVVPIATGSCDIDVTFAAGPPRFSATVKIAQASGCCAGLYPDPMSAGDVEIPDVAADGGGLG